MNRQTLIGFALGTVATTAIALLVAAEAKPAGTVGRFQLVNIKSYANGDTCWVIDTTNGHVWTHMSDGKTYSDQGMPPAGE